MYISQQSINMDRKKRALIILRRTLAEVNAALIGVMPLASGRIKASIAMSSEERTPSCPFDP